MSNVHKTKKLDLVRMFNDTSRYLIIDNPEFEKHPCKISDRIKAEQSQLG